MTKKKKKKKGSAIYSQWYTENFVADKIEETRDALVKREALGEIRSVSEWNEKAKLRFQRNFDRLSDATKKSYQSSARHFGKYLGIPKYESKVSNIVARLIILSYLEASTLVEEYVMWMETDLELSPNTINLRLASLRWFVDAARRVGWVTWKLDVKNVKSGKVRDTSGPSDAEFRRILRVVNGYTNPAGIRTKALVYLLAFTGMRISSAISLDIKNIDLDSGMIRVRWKGKGDKESQYVWRPVGDDTMAVLSDWIEYRGDDPGAVFCSTDRLKRGVISRLTIRTAQKNIESVGMEAATKKKLTPHGFRHFFATNNLKKADTRDVMKATGHTNIKTIEFYDDSDDTSVQKIVSGMEDRWLSSLRSTEKEDEKEIEKRYEEDAESNEDYDDDLSDFGIVSSVSAIENAKTYERIPTGMDSVDRLFGGEPGDAGMVKGSLVLLGGFPGIGKSTLARQIAWHICESNPGEKVLIASGEESAEQIGEALARLQCKHDNLLLFSEKSLNRICMAAERMDVCCLIVDSVSTVVDDECDKPPGSISQVKAIGHKLLSWCKGVGEDEDGSGIPVIVISHVDKKGQIAGPKALEHHVDAVFTFTLPHKRSKRRSLACDGKNRFGDATVEIFFEMTDKGLIEAEEMEQYGEDEYDSF